MPAIIESFSEDIKAPLPAVHKYTLSVQNMPVWRLYAVKAERLGGGAADAPLKEGDRYRVDHNQYGRRYSATYRVERVDGTRLLEQRVEDGRRPLLESIELESVGRHTRCTFTWKVEARGWWDSVRFILFRWSVRNPIKKQVKRNTLRLWAAVETRPAAEQAKDHI